MSYKNLIFEKSGYIGVLKLNRPKVLNSLNEELLHEFDKALDTINLDKNILVFLRYEFPWKFQRDWMDQTIHAIKENSFPELDFSFESNNYRTSLELQYLLRIAYLKLIKEKPSKEPPTKFID